MERVRTSAQVSAGRPAADDPFDVAIIGGGVNGCGIARDAAGRGYSVYLCEQDDLAGATSSASTKLLHGGLRYLEYYEFRLVREALTEREVVWGIAPPHRASAALHAALSPRYAPVVDAAPRPVPLRPYRRAQAAARHPRLDLGRDQAGAPLKPDLRTRGFEYSDCWVDDARLVVLNACDARDRGAVIETRARAVDAARASDG